ncbi:DUF7793 family protein [Formosa sp. A9]|uniref:DUF7793 family protein n=1 Tax=Formosa sp. A9 TaxID=3442641 RepID=UPI003EBC8426
MIKYYENEYASYRFSNGILKVTYHEGVTVKYGTAVKVVRDRLQLQEGQWLAVLCDIRGIKEIDKPARAYLAVEGSSLIHAVAFLIDTPVSKMMTKFYVRTSKPLVPSQVFDDEQDALLFLNKFKDSAF